MDKEEQSKLIPLGKGLAGWSPYTWHAEEGLPYRLELRVIHEDGRFVVDQLTVKRKPGGPPLSTEGLRDIPVAALLRLAVESNVMRVGPTIRDGNTSSWELTWASPLELSERAKGGGGPSDADLQTVADLYHVAYATSQAPTKLVMNRLGLPRSTASRWIALARKRGLLGPATPRKAGG
jgi:hypothetical protein